MKPEAAEAFAIGVLGWIAADETASGAFLGMSGASVDDLRSGAGDPAFLGFVLDYLLSDEAALIACCEALSAPPETALRARQALPGGDAPYYT